MCGFFTRVHNSKNGKNSINFASFSSLGKRGPDSSGILSGDVFEAIHFRLAINDLHERSKQPLSSEDGNFHIVFNGEIYNYKEIRSSYLYENNLFTTSDTEIVLQLFIKYGHDCLKYLRGMYSFAIWDHRNNRLFVARDPLGIKPLYYKLDCDGFALCSQAKALARYYESPIDDSSRMEFVSFGSVIGPNTIYKDIYEFPAGSYAYYSPHTHRIDFRKSEFLNNNSGSSGLLESQLSLTVRDSLIDTVKAHFVSDVDVGLFLSGGVDSATLLAVAKQLGYNPTCVTVAFEEFKNTNRDEAFHAKLISNTYSVEHRVRFYSYDEFEQSLFDFIEDMDQPSIDGLNTWFASKSVSELGIKVALSGVGADEIFSGYRTYAQLEKMLWYTKLSAKYPLVKKIANVAGAITDSDKLIDLAYSAPDPASLYFLKRCLCSYTTMQKLYGKETAAYVVERLIEKIANQCSDHDYNISSFNAFDVNVYMRNQLLRDSDWAGMAHSVEVRTPFVDAYLYQTLYRYAKSFRNGVGKRLMYNTPYSRIPIEILKRKKMGFSIPIDDWLDKLNYNNKMNLNSTQRWALFVAEKFK